MDLDPALAALRPLGGFFVLRTVPGPDPVTGRPDPGRLPTLAEAYARVTPDALAARVAVVAERLGTSEPRVAASIAHQGLAARLWSAALGCAVRYGRLPDLDPRLLRWDPLAGAPDDLCLTELRPLPGDAAGLAAAVLHGHLEPLTEALRAGYGSAPGLLWGNAGSALAGAAREVDRWARAHGRTDLAGRARALTDELFAHPLLRTTGTRTGTAFRRRSCCLYYRVPGGGVCGDCCFTRPPRSSPGAASG
ncbi:ferric iron reductase [Streptomyces incarnatus]|uniref:Ferric iron reductase n=1 Tax=Streptomyces incarnatus TaxID=665007 RepID=A0ABN4G606_9ACTN|nr:(2Fe-2S)-binding protein [Streptomyces incarnatus]AKJ09225.1 ferric iron reductase [Streptomyces incarnatus]